MKLAWGIRVVSFSQTLPSHDYIVLEFQYSNIEVFAKTKCPGFLMLGSVNIYEVFQIFIC